MTEYYKLLSSAVSYIFLLAILFYALLFKLLPSNPNADKTTVTLTKKTLPEGTKKDWIYLRKKIFKLYGRHCLKCNKKLPRMHIDHIKPKSIYKDLEFKIDNLQVLCGHCNSKKSNSSIEDYRKPYHLLALVKEIEANKLIKRKYVHDFEGLKKLTSMKLKEYRL